MYDLKLVPEDKLEGLIEHEVNELLLLENDIASLESFARRTNAKTLSVSELNQCKNICAKYVPAISTESLTVSEEGVIGTVILVAIMAIIYAIIYKIRKAIALIGALTKTSTDGAYFAAVDVLSNDISKLNTSISLGEVFNNKKLDVKLTTDWVSHIKKIFSEDEHLSDSLTTNFINHVKSFQKFIVCIGGNLSEYTVRDAWIWRLEITEKGVFETIIKYTKSSKTGESIRALEALGMNIEMYGKSLLYAGEQLKVAQDNIDNILRTGKSYEQVVVEFNKVVAKVNGVKGLVLSLVINHPSNITVKNFELINSQLKNDKYTNPLTKLTDEIIRPWSKHSSDKKAAEKYAKPFIVLFTELLADESEDKIKEVVTRYSKLVPDASVQWISTYSRYVLICHRYKQFIVRNAEIIKMLQS